jgi:hypothetical protein
MPFDRLDSPESLPVLNRRPSAALLLPSLFFVGLCAAALPVALFATRPKPGAVPPAAIFVGLLGLVGAFAFLSGVQTWLSNRCQLTPRRLFVTRGVVVTETTDLALDQLETINVKRGLFQWLLGCGDVVVTGTGQASLTMVWLANPEGFREAIRRRQAGKEDQERYDRKQDFTDAIDQGMHLAAPAIGKAMVRGLAEATGRALPGPSLPPLPGEAAAFYFTRQGQTHGPVTMEQLQQFASNGQLGPTDLVWKEGMPTWAPAANLSTLRFRGGALPPPPPLAPSAEEAEWYYSRDGVVHGPVTDRELRRLAEGGELGPEDLIWQEGRGDWRPARKVRGLLPG